MCVSAACPGWVWRGEGGCAVGLYAPLTTRLNLFSPLLFSSCSNTVGSPQAICSNHTLKSQHYVLSSTHTHTLAIKWASSTEPTLHLLPVLFIFLWNPNNCRINSFETHTECASWSDHFQQSVLHDLQRVNHNNMKTYATNTQIYTHTVKVRVIQKANKLASFNTHRDGGIEQYKLTISRVEHSCQVIPPLIYHRGWVVVKRCCHER